MTDAHEKCWLCNFWSGSRCTQTFRLIVHVEPEGGQVDISTTPGMVPEHLKPKMSDMFGKMVTMFLLPLIHKMPIWDEIAEYQKAKPIERMDCPAKKESSIKRDYLKLVN